MLLKPMKDVQIAAQKYRIKTLLRYYFSPIRLAKIQNLDLCSVGKVTEINITTLLLGMPFVQLLGRGIWNSNKTMSLSIF